MPTFFNYLTKKLIKNPALANNTIMRSLSKNKYRTILFISLAVVVAAIFSTFTLISIAYIKIPLDVNALSTTNLGIEIYDSSESESPVYYTKDKKIISIEHLSPHTINAFIAIEDKRFYKHNGYDLKRIVKAGLVNLKSGNKSQGASTITQQLIKNILLNSEKTYSRKFKEIVLAIKTEKNFSKEQILNMYLNSIYFGSNAYGIESASNLYFNKSSSQLDINESAILAGLIKSPSYYSPINNPDNCFARKNVVLQQMYDNGYISHDELATNLAQPVKINFVKNNYDNSYNQQAIIQACELLNISEKELLRQKLKLYTYMDNSIQSDVEKSLSNSQFAYDKLALVANNNGQVLAYSGDSYFDLSHMKRNPASTIKPLIVYLPAIASNTISPITPLLDEKIADNYSPSNAGDQYLGWISARKALAHSSNVRAVKLLKEIGLDLANEYAFKLNLINHYQGNYSIALGDIGGGVSAIDLARAYSVLQNNGIDKGLSFISKIENEDGKIIYQDKSFEEKLFNDEDCMILNDMLKTCATTGTAKRLEDLPFEVASKTGTAQINGKNSDLWNVAYTTEHLVLSWCGDATSQGLNDNFSSGFYPTLINKNILQSLYPANYPSNFKLNDNIVKIGIDSIEYETNHLVGLPSETAPERYKLYDLFKIDNAPTALSSTYQSPQFNLQVSLTTKGANVLMDCNSAYTYQVFAKTANTVRLVGTFADQLIDDKVFKYKEVEYYAIATNKYTDAKFTSEKITLYPEEYLVSFLNENYVNKNRQTKTRWYV